MTLSLAHPSTLDHVRQPVVNALAQVEALLQLNSPPCLPLSLEICQHMFEAGGKRLRPLVLLLSAGQLGYSGAFHIDLAAAIELVHTATLLHDDVVDDSPLRRGKPTVKQIWGNPASVLVGDYLYARAFALMSGTENIQVIQTMAKATQILAQGEILQLSHRNDFSITQEAHLAVLNAKTGTLFELSAALAGVIAGTSPSVLKMLETYGRELGIGFQLIDDALDYEGSPETLGKRLGDDFLDGSLTLPLIYTLREGSFAEKTFIKMAFESKNESHLPEIQSILKRSGALTYTRSLAETYIQRAISAIEGFPDTIHRQSMIELGNYALTRDF